MNAEPSKERRQFITQLLQELAGTKCRCGKCKRSRQTFCRSCYYSLPQAMRTRLYDKIGSGYESAYQAAVVFLDSQSAER